MCSRERADGGEGDNLTGPDVGYDNLDVTNSDATSSSKLDTPDATKSRRPRIRCAKRKRHETNSSRSGIPRKKRRRADDDFVYFADDDVEDK